MLQIVKTNAVKKADRIFLYGVEGIGKSTFGSKAPSPLFLDVEDGLAKIDASGVSCKCYADALAFLKEFPVEYKTLVIDTADALDAMMQRDLCERFSWETIEDAGYGKGWTALQDMWRKLLAQIDIVRLRGVEIIILAHSETKTFQNPAGPDYNRYQPKLNIKCGSVIKEWADTVLFACHEETVAIKKGQDRNAPDAKGKATGTGQAIMYTSHAPAWDAKNRDGLPPRLPLTYSAFDSARKSGTSTRAGASIAPVPQPVVTPQGPPATSQIQATAPTATGVLTRAEVGACLAEWQNTTNNSDIAATSKKFVQSQGFKTLGTAITHEDFTKIIAAIGEDYHSRQITGINLPPCITKSLQTIRSLLVEIPI